MDKGKGVAQFPDAFRAARNREYCTEIKTVIITPPRTRSIFQSRMYPVLQRPTVVIDRPLLFQRPRITAYLSFRLGCPLLFACSANFKRADNILQETRSFSAPRPRVNRLPYDRGGEGGGSPSPDARRSSNKVDETDGSTVGDIYIYSRYVSSGLNAIYSFLGRKDNDGSLRDGIGAGEERNGWRYLQFAIAAFRRGSRRYSTLRTT